MTHRGKIILARKLLIGVSILVVAVVALLIVINVNNNQDTDTYDYHQITEHVDIVETVETFTARFVHYPGLNARERSLITSPMIFTLQQDTVVQVSDRDRTATWVRIIHDRREGYVNQTYLRDFMIIELLVGDWQNGIWNIQPGTTLNSRSIRNLGIQARFNTLNSYNEETRFRIKIFDPNGNLLHNPRLSPSGYTYEISTRINSGAHFLGVWGTASGASYFRGSWRIEIWYENPANPIITNAIIASRTFRFD
jgi:hypothetical protein